MPLINGTPNADPAPPELTSGGGVMDWLSGMFGGARTLPTLPAEPAGPARDAYAGQSMTMPRADFRPGTDIGGSVPMSAEQADRMREASMELHDATMLAGGPMGAEAGTGAVALASRRTPVNLPPPSRGLINATGEAPGPVSILQDGTILSGETPVGRVKYDHGGASTRIGDIAINPSMQNQGIGSQVIRQIQDEAAARGNPVVLSTDAFRGPQAQADQLRLYDRLGFQPNTGPGQVSERIGGRKVAEDLVWQPPGFTTYHGTPHTFPPTERNPLGEFDPMKIGTGEGNQAYGVGAGYTAGAEPTAETYLQNANWSYGRQKAQTIYDNLHNQANERGLDNEGWSKLNAQREFWENVVLGRAPRQLIEDAKANPDQWGQHYLDYVNTLNPGRFRRVGGNMYEVRINADPEQYLNWDKPLSEQSPEIQKTLAPLVQQAIDKQYTTGTDPLTFSGGEAYSAAQSVMPSFDKAGAPLSVSASELSKALNDAGIPGLRYLDSGSRQAGQGTHNYVTFSPSIMTIIRRYGIAGLMAGAAATQGRDQTQ